MQTTQNNSIMVRKYTYQNVTGSLEGNIKCLKRKSNINNYIQICVFS